MNKRIIVLMLCLFFSTFVYAEYQNADLNYARISLEDEGVVFFEGFDFTHYTKNSPSLENMLQKTYQILKEEYKNKKIPGKEKLVPFVFVGHSQGGLRALAMATYLEKNDKDLFKQLKGVYTISGIDKGLKLLENQGEDFTVKLYNDVQVLTKGVYGTVKVFDFTPGNFVYDYVINSIVGDVLTTGVYNLGNWLLCDWFSFTKDFAYPIMNNSAWDDYEQIRDMCPQSDFITKYVLEESFIYCKHKKDTEKKTSIVWKKSKLGIKYPTIQTKNVPKTFKTRKVDMKINKELPMEFYIGTKSDSLSMAPKNVSNKVDKGMKIASETFRVAQLAHVAKCLCGIGLVTNSPAYIYDCGLAADWCGDYKTQISELIGEKVNDGLVAYDSQFLPTISKANSMEESVVLQNTVVKEFYENHADIVKETKESKRILNDSVKKALEEACK